MILLAISTSGFRPSAAICKDGSILCFIEGEGGHTHSETMMPLTEALMQQASLPLSAIDIFCADIGPGSFTGVRIGVCAINAMAFVNSKGVFGVSALEALAFPYQGRVCSMIDARNESAYYALYEDNRCVIKPQAAPLEDIFSAVPAGTLFVGDGADAYQAQIEKNVQSCAFARAELRADHIALLAHRHLQNERAEKEIYPLYLRPSQAERLFKEK